MEIRTHVEIDRELCGEPDVVEEGLSRVRFQTTRRMSVDETGLVHGGFIFGLADHAAMIAVNHPHVVLGAARVKFLKPVRAGEAVTAEARVTEGQGDKKQVVSVLVKRGETPVFEGEFTCFVLQEHVLATVHR